MDNEDLVEVIKKFAIALGEYLASLSEQQRKAFRGLRGIEGQTRRRRDCEAAIRQKIPDFNPPGLDQFILQEKAQTNSRAKEITDRIERKLQKVVLEELRRECGEDEAGWWMVGVPKPVRLKVSQKFEDDAGTRGGKEYYFDLIDYSKIALQNWSLFEPILAYGSGSKEKRLAWLDFVNQKRNIVSHASAAVTLTLEDLEQLQNHEKFLDIRISAPLREPDQASVDERG